MLQAREKLATLSFQRDEFLRQSRRGSGPGVPTCLHLALELSDSADTDEFPYDLESRPLIVGIDEIAHCVLLQVSSPGQRPAQSDRLIGRRFGVWP